MSSTETTKHVPGEASVSPRSQPDSNASPQNVDFETHVVAKAGGSNGAITGQSW